MMTDWISVDERLPEKPKLRHSYSEKVLAVVNDPNWEPDGLPGIDEAFPPRWLEEGRVFFPSSGGHYWVNLEERPIEELGLLVTHWATYPDLPEEEPTP